MAFLKKNFNNLIYAVVLAVVGVLCIIADTAESAGTRVDAFKAISTTVGIVFIVIASLALIFSILASFLAKKSALASALGSALVLGMGLFFVLNTDTAGTLILYFIALVPYLLICGGALLILHGIFSLIFGFVNKAVKEGLISGIASILIGGVTMLLGFLTVGNDPVIEKQLMIFGIIVILMAVFSIVSCFTQIPTAVVVVKKDEEEKAEENPAENA